MITTEERLSKLESWLKTFEEDFRKQQIKIDNLFSEMKKLKEGKDEESNK